MSHNVETMAYAGEVPWHGLGKRVLPDLTPEQMLHEAGVDWTVEKCPIVGRLHNDETDGTINVPIGENSALIRLPRHELEKPQVLDIVGKDWNVTQNAEAFNFFHEYVMAGDMEMHTAGSLRDGKIVWALARIKDSFKLAGGEDVVEPYLLFTNPHWYGHPIDIRLTAIRVVCNNTIDLALKGTTTRFLRIDHRNKFDADEAKRLLGFASNSFHEFGELAEFLASKKANEEDVHEFVKQVFPVVSKAEVIKKEFSKSAQSVLNALETAPGHDMAPGTWWAALNGVTYVVDHELGRSADNRLFNAWYGKEKQTKIDAAKLATKFAEAA